VDGDDVWVVQRRRRACFLLEAPEPLAVTGECGGQDFDGDVAAEARIVGAIHVAHAARRDGRDDFIGSEATPCKKWHKSVERFYAAFAVTLRQIAPDTRTMSSW
jgi:hypothetical protein